MDGAKPNPIPADGRASTDPRALVPPEGFVRLPQRLFARDADILQQVEVVALGNLAQRPALPGTREPSGNCQTRAREESPKPGFRTRQGTCGGIVEGSPAGSRDGHGESSETKDGPGRSLTERSPINKSRRILPAKHRFSGLPEFGSWRGCWVALFHH